MRIVHVHLADPFTEGMYYQENVLSEINASDGHEVYFITTVYAWKDNRIIRVSEEHKRLKNGVRLIRMPYIKIVCPLLTNKLRLVRTLPQMLEKIKPDIIMMHGFETLSVLPLIRYVKKAGNVKLAVDTHTDALNSAHNVLSRIFLHKILYTWLGKRILKYTDKIWCISRDTMLFAEKMNRIPAERLEYYPLGGQIFEGEKYQEIRNRIRAKHGMSPDDIILMHSGKMGKDKKTLDILAAFEKVKDCRLKLFIVGTMDRDVREGFDRLSGDDTRVQYVGWKSGDELQEYLCASDIYVQPGTQSATMQNAACCGCALALYPYESHRYLLGDNAFYIESIEEIERLFRSVLREPDLIREKREGSFLIAKQKLDYKKLAAKLYDI